MEPVPETERMEEFRSSPLPSLRLQSAFPFSSPEIDSPRKPPTVRRSTDPIPSSPSSPSWMTSAGMSYRPRTRSPLSGSHSRSRSVTSLAPPMARTQSMPGVNGAGHILYSPQGRSQSPSLSPSRIRIPRKPVDESFPTSPTRMSVHDPDRKLADRNTSPGPGITSAPLVKARRPASPLHQLAHSSTSSLPAGIPTTPSSIASSPSYRALDPVPYTLAASMPSSSVPSTPTSTRSRSPSISSLETIPDSPDAEEAALEAERIAQLKAAADAADGGDAKGKGNLELPTRGRTLSFGSRDKRKRWSVCGAERRQDLDLETIWED
ncbi:uncharacterized protein E0L32_003556 [Thyridium curvatum]|uniref:Basic proline-rich protein n=1 Tax=Thyridium curvatum TaxID=1093900 RepID=A0A507B0J2_9PEZI|nr:uncharacterized protein E0L32_003556 [Thyridium curvatum]TPX16615.1 hypothetical protein E0L32_003556 [Thyridium curvatum]